MVGKSLNGRFQLEQLLHKSESGSLFLATEISSGEMLTVRTLPGKGDVLRAEGGLRYLRLIRKLSAEEHPNLILPVEIGTAEGRPFQALPYLPGQPLEKVLAEAPLEREEALEVLRQVARGLAHIHGLGFAHLGLSPRTVWLSREEGGVQAALTDTGLNLLVAGEFPWLDAAPFRAPEEIPGTGGQADERADLYALGMLAYLLLAGRPPFTGISVKQVQMRHLSEPPPSPREFNPDLPERIANIVLKLVAKAPQERYQSAAGLLADLESGAAAPEADALGLDDRGRPRPAAPPHPNGPGRPSGAAEALARCTSGRGTFLLYSAGTGSGVREMFQALLPGAMAGEAMVLQADAPPQGWCAPFQLPLMLLEELRRRLPELPATRRSYLAEKIAGRVGGAARILSDLFPPLEEILPEPGAPILLPPGRRRGYILHVLAELFAALAEPRHPLVLWLGNLESADPDSLAWLSRLARRIPELPLLAVARIIPGREGQPPHLEPWLRAMASAPGLERVELPPLEREALTELTRHRLGLGNRPGHDSGRAAARLASWIFTRWGGNPFAHGLVLSVLLSRGLLRRGKGGGERVLRCEWEKIERLGLPTELEGLVELRLNSLTEGQRQVLEAAAIFFRPFTVADLSTAVESLPAETVLERVEELVEGAVLRRVEGGLVFAHRLFQDHFELATPRNRREHLHRLLGATMESHPSGPPLIHHHTAARHFELGGDTARADRHALAAANLARRAQAQAGAALAFQTVLARSEDEAVSRPLHVSLGAAQAMHGRFSDAIETLERVRGLDLPETLRIEAHRLSAWAEAGRGRHGAALARLEEAFAVLGESLPARHIGGAISRLAAEARYRYGGPAGTHGNPQGKPLEGREFLLAGLLEQSALLLTGLDPGRAVLCDERLLRLCAGRRPTPITVRALIRVAEAKGDPEGRYFRDAEALFKDKGFAHEAAAYQAALARCSLNLFDLRRAKDAAYLAGEGFGELGDPEGELESACVLFELARLQGPCGTLMETARRMQALTPLLESERAAQWAEATAFFSDALTGKITVAKGFARLAALAGNHGTRLAAVADNDHDAFLLLACELALAGENAEEALAALDASPAIQEPGDGLGGALLQAVRAEAHLVLAAAHPDDREWHSLQAATLLAGVRSAEQAHPRLAAEAALLEVMRLLLDGEAEGALVLARSAEQMLESRGAWLALARLRLRMAEGMKSRALPGWRDRGAEALSLFEAAGAKPWCQAVQHLLNEEGLPIPAMDNAGEAAAGEAAETVGFAAELLALVERTEPADPGSANLFYYSISRMLCGVAGADSAALFLPSGDDDVAPAAISTQSAQPAETPEINRWLVSKVWREGHAELLEKFQASPGGDTRNGAHSALCLPLGGRETNHGVIYLVSAAERMVFDRSDLERMKPFAEQAGTALALTGRTAAADAEQTRLTEEARTWEAFWTWCAAATRPESTAEILAALVARAPAPEAIFAALLYGADPDRARLELESHTLAAAPPELAAWSAVPLDDGSAPAAKSLRGGRPIRVGTLAGGTDERGEAPLLEALGAKSGVWVPLLEGEAGAGAVLLLSSEEPHGDSAAADAVLESAFRVIGPVLAKARRVERLTRDKEELIEKLHGSEAATLRLQRYVPRYLRTPGEAPSGPAAQSGEEIWRPFIAGHIFDLTRLSHSGKSETLTELGDYYARIGEALALHHGSLEQILGDRWIGRYEEGPESALWGALTLHQMLLALQEEKASGGLPVLRTGLGIHTGLSIGGIVETDQRIEPVLVGEGVQVAAHLAGMCRTFRAGVLISDETVQALEDVNPFPLRSLGLFRIAPAEKRVGVYELYSSRPAEIVETMQRHEPDWKAAMRHHRQGEWREAERLFKAYLTHLPQDRPARHFLRDCRRRSQA